MQHQLGLLSLNIRILKLFLRNGSIWNSCWLLPRAACLIQKHSMISSTSLSCLWTKQSCDLLQLKWAGSRPHCCGLAPFTSARCMFTLHSTCLVTPLGYMWCPWNNKDCCFVGFSGGFFSVQSAWNAKKVVLHHTRATARCQRHMHISRSGQGIRRCKYCWDSAEAQSSLAWFTYLLPRADLEYTILLAVPEFSFEGNYFKRKYRS